MRLFPSVKSIVVAVGLVVLMGWAYLNDMFVTGSAPLPPEASATVTLPRSADDSGSAASEHVVDAPWEEYRQVLRIDTAQFPVEVYGCRATVLVDFTADWCQPCQQQGQILERFARQDGTVKVVQVDVDRNRQLAQQFRVTTLPTLVVMRNVEVRRHVGLADALTVQSLLYQHHPAR